ncbi:MAG: glycosyltransferase [Muribaculaceae bacterium]|nr:glycosyltransferase [Muribaculaceae bacterium]
MSPFFSVIVPVYNRRDEIFDLLQSLMACDTSLFEIIVVEDGSSIPCADIVQQFIDKGIDAKYYFKANEGRSIARNYGLEQAQGSYFLFFDSDCVIPKDYFNRVKTALDNNPIDCFGGPDAAHESFSDLQKAISCSMTSFITTGGIRGGKVSMEKFTPRTFNMGFSRQVWNKVGGFREMFSEDIDMSTRIKNAGFSIGLIPDAPVYHKRRVSLPKFWRQVYVFGMSRITLYLLYPESLKIVHFAPAVFLFGSIILILLSVLWRWWCIIPLLVYLVALFVSGTISLRSLKLGALSVVTSIVQLCGYGAGFIKAFVEKIIFRKQRNIEEEILIRRGK